MNETGYQLTWVVLWIFSKVQSWMGVSWMLIFYNTNFLKYGYTSYSRM